MSITTYPSAFPDEPPRPLAVGQVVTYNDTPNTYPSYSKKNTITALYDDEFEIEYYSCMFWHTKRIPCSAIIEIIHDGVQLQGSFLAPEDMVQANMIKETIMRADRSKPIQIGDRVGTKNSMPETTTATVKHIYTVPTKTMGTVTIYIVLTDSGFRKHLLREEIYLV